ncbi:4-phosphoerythronate dehydrogenase [Idiomarina sp. HP20-50]|uniref:4-phosphoerythronate dehydrogenase n=1 Tax=Idiomarina sp. HP20-50 TaxID=3070813 RepID=UPI00294AA2DB|nr:4-phosphoerythronate dehydrogenase [Idiomarina sp. HP20-50]MDV6316847.1 4-phosphoerythronate dehydrogenase [Idiomarina sp. HP20-50]
MKIVADQNIPALSDLLSGAGTLSYFSERTPPKSLLENADALLVRSVTDVDDALLRQAPKLKFVASATIGIEHIDTHALQSREIGFAHAPGANAESVGEYVLCAVLDWLQRKTREPIEEIDVAIVGAGHTGQAAGKKLQALGLNVHYYDPPLCKKGVKFVHDHWQRVLTADIISCHVPLTRDGDFPTRHLFESTALQSLHSQQLLINASRGAVIDNGSLLERVEQGQRPSLVLDVWENEPEILTALVPYIDIATPHIAGHSLEGKVGGAVMIVNALLEYFGINANKELSKVLPAVTWPQREAAQFNSIEALQAWAKNHFDLYSDDWLFRQHGLTPDGFDSLRRNYRKESPRREFINQVITCHNSAQYIQFLQLGFNARQLSK